MSAFMLLSKWPNLAVPKSEILGFNSASSKILLGLRSLWMIHSPECKWRYTTPWEIPQIIWNNVSHCRESPIISSGKMLSRMGSRLLAKNEEIRVKLYSFKIVSSRYIIIKESVISKTCQIWICRGFSLACIHRPGPFLFHACNIPEASRCFCAEVWG